MTCHNCARKTLSLFIRSFTNIEPTFAPRRTAFARSQQSRFLSACSPLQSSHREDRRHRTKQKPDAVDVLEGDGVEISQELPAWAAQKKAMRDKLGGEAWNPRKKLSPDTMDGIRHLHNTQPNKFTTPVLAQHFKVSPEAIRRILKSKWRPTEEEAEARLERWDKRGERIWSNLVELGVKPPKSWRQMGVGRAKNGEKPKWKGRRRLLADVNDNVGDDFKFEDSDIIPIVDSSGRSTKEINIPLTQRL